MAGITEKQAGYEGDTLHLGLMEGSNSGARGRRSGCGWDSCIALGIVLIVGSIPSGVALLLNSYEDLGIASLAIGACSAAGTAMATERGREVLQKHIADPFRACMGRCYSGSHQKQPWIPTQSPEVRV